MMNLTNRTGPMLLLVTLWLAVPAAAQQLPLEKCQALKDEVARYRDLRRRGGSAAEMDGWKRARRAAERRYHDASCHYYGRQLE